MGGENVSNYDEHGGARTVIGGSLDVVSGGDLDIESGGSLKLAGTAISSTAAELNALDGITSDVDELNALDGAPLGVTIAVAAEDTNVVAVTIQLEAAGGDDVAARGSVFAYLSDDANGDSIAGTAPDGGWAIGTDGLLIPVVANKAAVLVSESDGDIDINVTESGTDTWYLIVALPNGTLVASAALTFAA